MIAHAIEACRSLGWEFEFACCIYPGVPFIQAGDLEGALADLARSGADYCFPVTEFPSAIQRALRRDDSGRMQPFFPENEQVRTQDLEVAYHVPVVTSGGQLFVFGTDSLGINTTGAVYQVDLTGRLR